MRRRWATIYAIACTLLMLAGFVVAFIFAWQAGQKQALACLLSMVMGFIIAPIFHEVGHLFFLSVNKMECVYIKCFCLKQYIKNGLLEFCPVGSSFFKHKFQCCTWNRATSGNSFKNCAQATMT